jgi:predicted RecA/RadA family phage recombinase
MSAGDRDNFSGDISVTAPTGGYTKGKIYLIADSYYVARETKAAGAACLMASLATGAVWAEKLAGTGKTVAVGDKVYVKTNIVDATTSSGAVLLPAVCIRAAAAADTRVLLAGGGISPTAT